MVDGTFRHNDRRCGGQLRGRLPSWLGRDRNSKLLLSEAAAATNSRQSSLYQQTKLLRYGSYEGGKVIIYTRHIYDNDMSFGIKQDLCLIQVNTKRQPSFSGSTNGNGTLRGKNNPNVNTLGSPKLYPKSLDYESATLKRNSHGQQHIRVDPDQDKYY